MEVSHALRGSIQTASIALFLAIVLLLSLRARPQALEARTIGPDSPSAAPAKSQESDDDSDKKKPEGDEDEPAKPEKEEKKAPARKLSIEEQYVHKRIEDYLHPDSLVFLPDGRVKMVFDFRKKNPAHERIFTPPVSPRVNTVFRWSVPGEEYWSYGGTTTGGTGSGGTGPGGTGTLPGSSVDDPDPYWGARGLRLGNTGRSVLNCWFKEGVESEIFFFPAVSYQSRQIMALTYTSKSGSLGCNFGSQCALFSKSGRIGKRAGDVVPSVPDRQAKFKLKVKGGYFESFLNGRKKAKAKYSTRSFKSGRIGLIWGGGMASFVSRMEITGNLDYAQMFKVLRKIPESEE